MTINASVLNRLIAARHLIETSGPELTALSAPLAVAQKILVAQDSAELVFWGLSSHVDARPLDAKGVPMNNPPFMALAIEVLRQVYGLTSAPVANANGLLDEVNRTRVAFKHFGILPNVGTSWHLFADIRSLLNDLCLRAINSPLLSIDQIAAIEDEIVRNGFEYSRGLFESEQYQEALEAIAQTLWEPFWQANLPGLVIPGKPSTEDALILSGRGIDPASFLTMQKILPEARSSDGVEWHLRETGHSENWTAEHVSFCLETAISCVVKLQGHAGIPRVNDFYTLFDDVLEVVVDDPEIIFDGGSLGLTISQRRLLDFNRGDRIIGRLKATFDRFEGAMEPSNVNLAFSPYYILENARHEKLPEGTGLYKSNRIRIPSEQVRVSHQPNDLKLYRDRQNTSIES